MMHNFSTNNITLLCRFSSLSQNSKHCHKLKIQAHMLAADQRCVLPVNPKIENKVYAKILWGMTTDSFTYAYLCTIY